MSKCFVIQPFDKGKFDKRFDDVFAPAISKAGLEPYRVDRDPSVSIPIEDIESEIEGSRACLADITTDNPNVWFELGFAIACRREVVLVCSSERTSDFPFDVHHRNIIKYTSESPRDFDDLSNKITERLKGILEKEGDLGQVARMNSLAAVEGLEQYEIATLIAVAQQLENPYGAIYTYAIRNDMEKTGFNNLATTLGLTELLNKNMLSSQTEEDHNGEVYTAYQVTSQGMKWLIDNRNKLKLKIEPPKATTHFEPDDDLPF